MRNLAVSRQSYTSLETLKDEIPCNIQYGKMLCTFDSNNKNLYFASCNHLHIISSNGQSKINSYNINCGSNAKLIGLEYSSITQEIFCAYENGVIATINVESRSELELATQVNEGLRCIKLSPDHEILILITVNDTIITMVSSFEIISKTDLQAPEFGQKQFITVGWGKKETQFHGSAGKAAATIKQTQIHKNDYDDGLPRISWRGDGSLFAISFIENKTQIRQLKVFNREGILQYTSELTSNLEEPLSWKPSGNLIATTQKLINKHIVSFFEKNGLKHREFSLPFEKDEVIVRDIFWSPDSDVLTITCEQIKTGEMILQLWTENNYHWYLKQTFTFSKDNPLLYSSWSSTAGNGKTLILLTLERILTYSFYWTINQSKGQSLQDKAVIGVIDGKKVLLTGFRVGIVPPPMAHQTVELSNMINAIVFAPNVNTESNIDTNNFFCVLQNANLAFFNHISGSDLLEYEHVKTCKIEWDETVLGCENMQHVMQHFLWFKKNTILCSLLVNNHSVLCLITSRDTDHKTESYLVVKQTYVMDGLIEHIISSSNEDEAYIIVEGSVFRYKDGEVEPTEITLQKSCHKVEVVQISRKCVIISLSHDNCLSIDGKEIANNINSFHVHSEFLLLTTLQHTLICVTLENEKGIEQLIKQDLTVKPWENNLHEHVYQDLNVRRIERGSRLLITLSKDSKVILQMPRGNLECIQPRALSLYIIGVYLTECDYFAAFDLMRKQRINLNLLYDHDPQKFLQNATKFVEDIMNTQWLSLFLSELQEEDVTNTIYANCYSKRNLQTVMDSKSIGKVARVCDLLKNIMEKRQDADQFVQPILISLVKNHEKQGLEAALKKIKEIQISKPNKSAKTISAEDALKYLLYLVDVNILFDTALGMYDFELTMFIASKSQKDPKEYVPFLNDLKKLDENYMKYSIDMHLKRYESALEHISKQTEKFNECITLIKNQQLYIKSLKLFKKDSKEYKEVAQVYGEYLLNKKFYKEAAIMFDKAECRSEALNAYKLAVCWQEAIIVSTQMNLSCTELHELYKDLVMRLKDDRRYLEAAQVFLNYLNDPEESIALLCDGKHWKDATRIAFDVYRLDLIETHIKPGVQEHAKYIMTQIDKNAQNFEKYKLRLAVVRNELSVRQTRIYEDTETDNESLCNRGFSDFLSDTSSITGSTITHGSKISTVSKKSYKSSKNRRKQERKIFSLKEGSMFEDLGLMRALHEIITITYKQNDELPLLIQMLLYFNNDEYAEKLQTRMNDFLRLIESKKSEIWNKLAPSSFAEMESIGVSTTKQYQESFLPQKLIEPHIMYPPEKTSSTTQLRIF